MAYSLRFVALEPDGSVPVTIVGGGGAGGTSSTDEAAFTPGTSAGTPAMGAFETVPSQLTNGQLGIIALDEDRNVKVNIVEGGGGGTQYAQGTATTDTDVLTMAGAVRRDTAAIATGVADGDRLVLSTDNAGRLRTTAADTTQPVSAATLPLPTGAATLAEQQAQTTILTVLDDWDETNRAAVNLIAGQVGVQGAAGASTALTQRVAIATDANAIANPALTDIGAGEYETVAASQTAQVLGGTGAIGDFLAGLLVTPATTSPGNVIILDNAISITVFAGGASSVSNLVPFFIPLGIKSVSGAWKVTTGANVSVIGVGNFSA